jgi:hypothetical protein
MRAEHQDFRLATMTPAPRTYPVIPDRKLGKAYSISNEMFEFSDEIKIMVETNVLW